MDKDEILEKNRQESGLVDERFRLMQLRVSYVMVCAMLFVWAILFVWDSVHGADTSVGSAIMLSGVAAMGFCQFWQLRMKSSLVFGLLAAFGAVAFAAQHVMLTM